MSVLFVLFIELHKPICFRSAHSYQYALRQVFKIVTWDVENPVTKILFIFNLGSELSY